MCHECSPAAFPQQPLSSAPFQLSQYSPWMPSPHLGTGTEPRSALCTPMPLGCARWLRSLPQPKALALTQLTPTWDLLPINEKRRVWEAPGLRHHCPTTGRGFLMLSPTAVPELKV